MSKSIMLIKEYISLIFEAESREERQARLRNRSRQRRIARSQGRAVSAIPTEKYDRSNYDIGVVYQNDRTSWVYVILYKKVLDNGSPNPNIVKSSRKHFLKIKNPKSPGSNHIMNMTVPKGTMPFELEKNSAYIRMGLVKCLGVFDSASVRNIEFIMEKYIRENLGSSESQFMSVEEVKRVFRNYNITLKGTEAIEAHQLTGILAKEVEKKIEDLKIKLNGYIEYYLENNKEKGYSNVAATCIILGLKEPEDIFDFTDNDFHFKEFLIQYYEEKVRKDLISSGSFIDENDSFKLSHACSKLPNHIYFLSKSLIEKKSKAGSLSPKEQHLQNLVRQQRSQDQTFVGRSKTRRGN